MTAIRWEFIFIMKPSLSFVSLFFLLFLVLILVSDGAGARILPAGR